MSPDFIQDLLQALTRVLTPDGALLKEVLIVSGMPEGTENLRYLGFNRQVVKENGRTLEFSAVAVINNRRAGRWKLAGRRKKLSQIVFHTRWTRNPLDLFLNNLRCDEPMMDLLGSAAGRYTLLGILTVDEIRGRGLLKRRFRSVRPVVAVAGVDEKALETIIGFEKANEIKKVRVRGLPLYRKTSR